MRPEAIRAKFIRKENMTWHQKAAWLDIYHTLQQTKFRHWGIRDTARELRLSIGMACQFLKLATLFKDNPAIKKLSLRKALKEIHGRNFDSYTENA